MLWDATLPLFSNRRDLALPGRPTHPEERSHGPVDVAVKAAGVALKVPRASSRLIPAALVSVSPHPSPSMMAMAGQMTPS